MKKILTLLFSLILTTCAIGLVGCGHEHVFTRKLTAPTCEEAGYTKYVCECGYSFRVVEESIGHEFTNYVYNNDETCSENGTETAVCNRTNCQETHTREKVDSKCHNAENGICTRCGVATNLEMTLSEDGTYYIVTGEGDFNQTSLKIPAEYNNLPVKEIGAHAFSEWCYFLTSLEIPNSITTIGESAFYACVSLESLVIPDSVMSIGRDAFSSCFSLESLVIGNNVTSIGAQAFSNCNSLTSVVIPKSVENIGYSAFWTESDKLTIYCEVEIKPVGWAEYWKSSNIQVIWDCLTED